MFNAQKFDTSFNFNFNNGVKAHYETLTQVQLVHLFEELFDTSFGFFQTARVI